MYIHHSGHRLTKQDFEGLLRRDRSELKCAFKLTSEHLNVKGKKKQRVFLAVQLFSRTTASAWKMAYPNKSPQAEFIQLVNDWFDLSNSRNPREVLPSKKPFGLDFGAQSLILDRMEHAIIRLRVGHTTALYPFQRGMLISIHSLRGVFANVSGSAMRISYILTHRLIQDYIENCFSIMRKMGGYNDNPSPVDAKHRLKLVMLSWGANCSRDGPVEMEDSTESFLTGRMIRGMMEADSGVGDEELGTVVVSDDIPILDEFTDNFQEEMLSMGMEQR
jgi:hypothetical protein